MVELSLGVVQPEQERTDFLLLLGIAEAADDAVGGALLIYDVRRKIGLCRFAGYVQQLPWFDLG